MCLRDIRVSLVFPFHHKPRQTLILMTTRYETMYKHSPSIWQGKEVGVSDVVNLDVVNYVLVLVMFCTLQNLFYVLLCSHIPDGYKIIIFL